MTTKKASETEVPIGSWKHLLYAAESLMDLPKDKEALSEAIRMLNSLEEHFPRTIDPVNDFPAYAVRRFCLALNSVLEDLSKNSPNSSSFFGRLFEKK